VKSILLLAARFYKLTKIADSRGNITKLGYPKILADIFQERFGKWSFVIARWMKEKLNFGGRDWWDDDISWKRDSTSLSTLLEMYDAASQGPDTYSKWRDENGYPSDIDFNLDDHLDLLKKEITEKLLDRVFFSYTIIKDLLEGKIKNPKRFTKLPYEEASDKYQKEKLFKTQESFLKYENGYRWIDVGKRCELMGKEFQNCGSVGVMSTDPDRTMIILFDENNKPRLVTTYSPNQNRISSVQGARSSAPKPEYYPYLIDLVSRLQAEYEEAGSEYSESFLEEKLGDILIGDLELIFNDPRWFGRHIYKFLARNGETYYTTRFRVISEKELNNVIKELENNELFLISLKQNLLSSEEPEPTFLDYLKRAFLMERGKGIFRFIREFKL